MSSLKRRKPEKLKRQAVASRKSDKEPDLSASATIAPSISIDIGSFLVTGLASEHCKPSKLRSSSKRVSHWRCQAGTRMDP